MYVRFTTPQWVACARTHRGFFTTAFDVRDAETTPRWIADSLNREIRWFDDHLAVPDRLRISTARGRQLSGVCWFRDRANEHVSRARYICWLLVECGNPITELRGNNPGTLIWQDSHQIVALTPRARRR